MKHKDRNPPLVGAPASEFFVWLLTSRGLGFPLVAARTLWDMMRLAGLEGEREATLFLRQTEHVWTLAQAKDPGALPAYVAYCTDWLTGDLLQEALDELVQRQEVTPQAAARVRRNIRTQLDAQGRWIGIAVR
jgi:hypothetical protein